MKDFNIKKILVPLDLSNNSLLALEHASFMAKLYRAELVLAHVLETHTLKLDLGAFTASDKLNAEQKLSAKLDQIATDLKIKTGAQVHYIIKTGKIAAGISEASKEINADLIIMGTHGVSGVEEFFLGSNAYRVITEAEVPVISVQTHAKKLGYDRILCPIDNSEPSREKARFVMNLAKHYNSKVHILGILSLDDDDAAVALDKKINQVAGYFENHGISHQTHMVEGENLAEITIKQAKANDCDLIAIMTEQEESFSGMLLGPFAQQVVNHSKIPVMSIKPATGGYSDNLLASGM